MINNKILFLIIVALIPFVVISFVVKDKTNFNLKKIDNNQNDKINVRVLVDGSVEYLDLEEYVVGVVAGEMPASFEEEALKAQAVASRSYALFKKNTANGEYDLTDNTNSQVYLTKSDMQIKWGSDYDKYYNRIKNAVDATHGEVVVYDGKIIEAFYFAMSSGMTQDASAVFNESTDYLKSTVSEYDNEDLNNYEVTKSFEIGEFINILSLNCKSISVDYINYNASGYVDDLSICNTQYDGNKFRDTLGLRSANFKINITSKVDITTYGYGHGVGMSQYGANGYAKNGYTYKDIINHYYQNVEIINLKNV